MSESIADVVVKLARRELASAAPADDPLFAYLARFSARRAGVRRTGFSRTASPQTSAPEFQSEESPTPAESNKPANDGGELAVPTSEPMADLPDDRLNAASIESWTDPMGAIPTDAVAENVDPFVARSWGHEIPDLMESTIVTGSEHPVRTTGFSRSFVEQSPARAAFERPPEAGTTNPAEKVDDQARGLEQVSRELDASLDRLFATQLETLDHLRQRLDEHERHWLEQNAARRAVG